MRCFPAPENDLSCLSLQVNITTIIRNRCGRVIPAPTNVYRQTIVGADVPIRPPMGAPCGAMRTSPPTGVFGRRRRDRRPRRSAAGTATGAPHPVRHHVPRRPNSHPALKFLPSMFADLHNNNYSQPMRAGNTRPYEFLTADHRRDRRSATVQCRDRNRCAASRSPPCATPPQFPPHRKFFRCLSLRINITKIIRNRCGRVIPAPTNFFR